MEGAPYKALFRAENDDIGLGNTMVYSDLAFGQEHSKELLFKDLFQIFKLYGWGNSKYTGSIEGIVYGLFGASCHQLRRTASFDPV